MYGDAILRRSRIIATEMYGMMPSAKTEKRSSAPPENRFAQPKSVPFAWSKKFASAWPSIPGVGTATPIRYTASISAVKISRRRSSGIRDAFPKPSSIAGWDYLFYATACVGNLFARALRKRIGAHDEFLLHVSVS